MNKFRLSVRFLRPTFFKRAGMTLSELMIAGGLGVLLIGSAVYFGMRFQQGASLDSAKSDLYEKMQVVSRQFSMDLSNAIRVKGHPDFAPAVFRVEDDVPATDPRGPTDQFDHIRMYVIHEKSFSAAISIEPPDPDGVDADIFSARVFENQNEGQDVNQERSWRFIEAALLKSDEFLVSNSRSSFLIEKVNYSAFDGSEGGEFRFRIRLLPERGLPNIDFSSARIQAVKKIEYKVESGRLERKVFHFRAYEEGVLTREQLFAGLVKQFHVNWFFADRRNELFGDPDSETLISPADPMSAPSGNWLWTDISAAQIDMELESEKSFSRGVSGASTATQTDEDDLPLADSMCRWADVGNPSKLICRSIDVASATDFEELLIGSDEASVGAVDCLPEDRQNRCRAGCQASFTSSNSGDLNWVGYAAGSDWCKCVANIKIASSEFNWGSHTGGFPGSLADQNNPNHRYNACVRDRLSNTSCDGLPSGSDPRLVFVCNGIVNSAAVGGDFRGNYLDVNKVGLNWPPQESVNQERFNAWMDLRAALLAIKAKAEATPFYPTRGGVEPHFNPWMPTDTKHQNAMKKVKCYRPSDSVSWAQRDALNRWLGSGSADILTKKYCACLIYQLHPDTLKPHWVDGSFPPVHRSHQIPWDRWSEPSVCPNFYLQPPNDDSDASKTIFKSSYLGTASSCNEATGQSLVRFVPSNCCTGSTTWNGPGCENTVFGDNATYVQCIRQHGAGNSNFSNYRLPISTPLSNENPRPPNYEQVWEGWVTLGPREGSSQSQRVTIKYKASQSDSEYIWPCTDGCGEDEDWPCKSCAAPRSCARLDCDYRSGDRLSCCVAENRRLTGANLADFLTNRTPTTRTRPPDDWQSNTNFDHTPPSSNPTPPSGDDAITNKADWSSYCNERCPDNTREVQYFTHRGWRSWDGWGAVIADPQFAVNERPACSQTPGNHFRVPWCASRTRVNHCPPSQPQPNQCPNSSGVCASHCACSASCCDNCDSNPEPSSAPSSCCEASIPACCTPSEMCGVTSGD